MNDRRAASNKIVHVLNGLSFGGNESTCFQNLRFMTPFSENVLVNLNPDKKDMLPKFCELKDVKVMEVPYGRFCRAAFVWRMTRLLRRERPRAVLAYCFGVHVLIGLAARLAGVPNIAVHAGNPAPKQKHTRRIWRRIIIASRWLGITIHGCSQSVDDSLRELDRLPANSFAIPSGCDVMNIAERSGFKNRKVRENDRIVIAMVARLDNVKDHSTLLRAFAQVKNRIPTATLWLVGEGREETRLRQLAGELELGDQVVFFGKRSDIPELLGQADIFAFSTTEDEGLGISLIEAMAAGLPVVASKVSACREIIKHNDTGVLVPQGDPAALADALERLARDSSMRFEMGQRAHQRAMNQFAIQESVKSWRVILLRGEGVR